MLTETAITSYTDERTTTVWLCFNENTENKNLFYSMIFNFYHNEKLDKLCFLRGLKVKEGTVYFSSFLHVEQFISLFDYFLSTNNATLKFCITNKTHALRTETKEVSREFFLNKINKFYNSFPV